MAVEKIQIKNLDEEVIFEYECEGNTLKRTVEIAVKQGASLVRASLDGASLDRACLVGASLVGASLVGASLVGACLVGAINIPYIPVWCPSDGAFTGWKKVHGRLVELLIPADAERCSATTRKCRCNKAVVVSILNLDTKEPEQEILNTSQVSKLLYKVGEEVLPDSYDTNRWDECSHGIHFFINKQDAIDY